ncbi:DUF58 domain-containing protein [Candidatus Bipolaricaulota bacterium]|nr:DUF58 domain-containing protein [Candidatus Bipolaricaulota bacterium]
MISAKARTEFLAFLAILFAGLALRHPGFLGLAVVLATHLVFGLILVPKISGSALSAQRIVEPKRLHEGHLLQIQVHVRNLGRKPVELRISDGPYPGFSVTEGKTWAWGVVAPQEELSLSYVVRPARGIYKLSGVQVEILDPLGLTPRRLELPCPGEVAVLPRVEDLLRVDTRPRRTLTAPGTARARRGGMGLEFHGVREYRPGDNVRRLAWKVFARRDEPAVVEFEEERAADVAVILDVRARAYFAAPSELFEFSVRAAAALAQYFLRQGNRVALLKYGAVLDWIFPGYGRRHGERILRELAEAKLGKSEVFAELDHLPTRLLPAGSLIVLVSPLILGDEDTLGKLVARGYRVFAVLPDPVSLEFGRVETEEEKLVRRIMFLERWVLLRRLRRAGVTAVVWDVRRPLSPLLRRLRGERLCL